MKILNATCYNTEDLTALLQKVARSMDLNETRERRDGGYVRVNDAPTEVIISYYQPSRAINQWTKLRNYASGHSNGEQARVGIVRPSAFDIAPLKALAQAADSDSFKVPSEAVVAIVNSIAESRGWYKWNGGWDLLNWAATFNVRYNLRAKRGSKAIVKKALDQQRAVRLKQDIEQANDDIIIANKRVVLVTARRDKKVKLLVALEERLDGSTA